ncbi:MAG: hypothetical protein RL023_142 [Candidatus Parcubacteria bacterium]
MKKIPLTIFLLPLFFLYLQLQGEGEGIDFTISGLFISTKISFIILGAIILFAENMKSTIFDTKTNITDILLSGFVFVCYLIGFLLLPVLKHEMFFAYFIFTTFDLVGGIITTFAINRRGIDVNN